jgi:exodeoxyribonuclease-3
VAILARDVVPVETRRGLSPDPDPAQSRYIEAAVGGIVVGCLYLPNGNPQPGPKFDYKLAWSQRFNAYAQELWSSGQPVVLAGDYNVVPTDFDIYNPKSWLKDALLQPESRALYRELLAQGWSDALRARYPDQRIYTFWDYFRQHWPRNAGLRIDHLLLSSSLAPRLADAGVDTWVRGEPGASDHAPAWVALEGASSKPAPPKAACRARGEVDACDARGGNHAERHEAATRPLRKVHPCTTGTSEQRFPSPDISSRMNSDGVKTLRI